MGPITDKINKLIKNADLSEETNAFLESLKKDIADLEMKTINMAYDHGHFDCERGIRSGNYYNKKYSDYLSTISKK